MLGWQSPVDALACRASPCEFKSHPQLQLLQSARLGLANEIFRLTRNCKGLTARIPIAIPNNLTPARPVMSDSKKYRYPRKDDYFFPRRFVFFCSVKGFYCGRAKRVQTIQCTDCPAESKEMTGGT